MKIKVPSNYKFLSQNYTISFASHLWHDEHDAGQAIHRTGQIKIDPSINKSEWLVTLNHELIEVMKHHLSLKLDHDDLDRIALGFANFMVEGLKLEFDWSDIKEVG